MACVAQHMAVAKALGLSSSLMETMRGRMEAAGKPRNRCAPNPWMRHDAMVAAGELASTTLVAAWLSKVGMSAHGGCARHAAHLVRTALRAWMSPPWTKREQRSAPMHEARVVVTQGFIGRHADGSTVRWAEGSDYSAALLAVAVGAEGVTIWKDVPGMMNADPKPSRGGHCPQVDHEEALELSYYGASVIHPRPSNRCNSRVCPCGSSRLWPQKVLPPASMPSPASSPVPMFIWRDHQTWMEIYTADGSFLRRTT